QVRPGEWRYRAAPRATCSQVADQRPCFLLQKRLRANEGLSERKVERDFFGIKQRRRGMWRRRTGRKFLYIQVQ
ncbi:hypothetical protein, partial [Klebsiella pneumoniae]|uniref:hypothetical protein n=1 Tax=Klebsiella pneumoniae TaxID=573 RepID=UPI003C7338C6